MQPQSVDAECVPADIEVGETFTKLILVAGKEAIKRFFKKIGTGKKDKEKQKDECLACGKNIGTGSGNCAGASELCSGNWTPPGCGNPHYPCQSNHSDLERCKNKKCKSYNDQYRKCTTHTCNNKKKSSTSLENTETAFSNWYWFAER